MAGRARRRPDRDRPRPDLARSRFGRRPACRRAASGPLGGPRGHRCGRGRGGVARLLALGGSRRRGRDLRRSGRGALRADGRAPAGAVAAGRGDPVRGILDAGPRRGGVLPGARRPAARPFKPGRERNRRHRLKRLRRRRGRDRARGAADRRRRPRARHRRAARRPPPRARDHDRATQQRRRRDLSLPAGRGRDRRVRGPRCDTSRPRLLNAAALYGCGHERAATPQQLRDTLHRSLSSRSTTIIEVRTDRLENLALHRRVADAVAHVLTTIPPAAAAAPGA